METLLQSGAEIDMPGGPVGSPVMAACVYDRLEALKLLVYEGACLLCTDVGDNGILWRTVRSKTQGFPEVTKMAPSSALDRKEDDQLDGDQRLIGRKRG